MNRLVMIGGLVVVAGLAVAVYRAKLGAEETQGRIDGLKGEVATTEKDIAVMRAEEAYLTRPERIGPLARDRLGLEPASPDQYTASEALKQRLGEERLTLPAPEAEVPAQTPASPAQQ